MKYVIVGNGITGVSAAQTIRQSDDAAEIVIIGEESPYFYSRTALMWVYMGQLKPKDLEPHEPWYWQELGLDLVQDKVTAIAPQRKELTLQASGIMNYDRLLLAMGGSANMFGWPGQDLDGVCNMCTLGDLQRLEGVRPRLKRAVVVGGGLIGIELVEMMLHQDIPVTYLLREPWYWDLVLSREEGEMVHQRLREHGVNLVLEDEISEIVDNGAGKVGALKTKGGLDLPCELVGVAVGVHSNTGLAREAGLQCGRAGILVDSAFRCSAQDIFAAGDCAEMRFDEMDGRPNLAQKLWYTGLRQGRAAGRSMSGDPVQYDPGIPYNSAQFLFLDYLNVGWFSTRFPYPPPAHLRPEGGPDSAAGELQQFYHRAPDHPASIRVAYWPGSEQVMGFSMLGARWDAAMLREWIAQRRTLKWVLDNLHRAVFNEEFQPNRFEGVSQHA